MLFTRDPSQLDRSRECVCARGVYIHMHIYCVWVCGCVRVRIYIYMYIYIHVYVFAKNTCLVTKLFVLFQGSAQFSFATSCDGFQTYCRRRLSGSNSSSSRPADLFLSRPADLFLVHFVHVGDCVQHFAVCHATKFAGDSLLNMTKLGFDVNENVTHLLFGAVYQASHSLRDLPGLFVSVNDAHVGFVLDKVAHKFPHRSGCDLAPTSGVLHDESAALIRILAAIAKI